MAAKSCYRSPAGEKQIMALYDSILARWPVPHDDLIIPTRYGATFIIASGNLSAPPLVLLHGVSSNAVSWEGDISEYSRYFRVYAVDIPGDPGKSSSERLSLNNHAQAEWMEDLLNALKISRTNLLGISLGGWTALRYATYHPERIRKLVVLTPAGVVQARFSFLLKVVCLIVLDPLGFRTINHSTFNQDPIHPETIKFMDTITAHFKTRIGRMHMFTDSELRRLTMPTLLLGGRQDVIQNVEKIALRMAKFIPHLVTRIYPHKGHILSDLAPEILPFLISRSTREFA